MGAVRLHPDQQVELTLQLSDLTLQGSDPLLQRLRRLEPVDTTLDILHVHR
jgi:hypothetical protein